MEHSHQTDCLFKRVLRTEYCRTLSVALSVVRKYENWPSQNANKNYDRLKEL
jgi:hypothetical protein